MRCPDLTKFEFISVRDLIDHAHPVPDKPGCYGFFLRGGSRLLEATDWYKLDGRRPLTIRRHALLYVGAANWLGERFKQHMRIGNLSSLRKSLLAVEYMREAISRSGTPACNVRGQCTLTRWLCGNAIIGFRFTKNAFEMERRILAAHPSPFNIAWRREHPYARQLSAWKCEVFPKGDSEPVHRMRKL
jgi:hypothetical protein